MDNEKEKNVPRKNNRMGPPGRMNVAEKPKDFKVAIKRLIKELNTFKILVIISLVLAMFSALLSIMAPDRLSSLTDEISKGLVVNSENIELLTNKIIENLSEEKLSIKVPEILSLNFSGGYVQSLFMTKGFNNVDSTSIKEYAEYLYNNFSTEEIAKIQNTIYAIMQNPLNISNEIEKLPEVIQKEILNESVYNGITITFEDKKQLLNLSNITEGSISDIELSNNLQNAIFEDIEINGENISKEEQYIFLKSMSSLNENSDVSEIYSKIDEMPESIQKLIKPKMNIDLIKKMTIILVIMYLISALFSYIQSITMTHVANKFANKLRGNISKKINKLELSYFDKHQLGDILSRVTNDVDTIAQSMNQSLATLVTSITLFLGSIIMMFYTNWIMAITAILSSLFGFAGMMTILKKSQKYFIERQKELGNLNAHIEEIYSGLNVVKVYNGKKKSDMEFDEYNQKVCESNRKSQFLSGLMHPIMGFIGNFGYVAVCVVGALLTSKEIISFGVIVAFITYVRLFTNPLSQIAQAMTSLQSTAASGERVFEFLDEKEMEDESNITKKLIKENVKGNIEFENVVFKYDNNDTPTIKNFTASAKSGQKIAIVGPTGAGKTTMVNLLMKFYNITSGNIKIDGVSTKELTRENIQSLFTMVLQDTWLFEGTIKENIVYNKEDVSDEKVMEVCKIVGLDHFIKTLPNGINTLLSENESVSAGQRQLLTIARGMIQDSPFLILDEATSNVDTRTEELVQKAMDKLAENRTSFIIAHRLSTIKNADLILVMKEGNIIEQGNHEQLMSQNGFYADLYNSQFQL